ncbi:hypothetical protein AB0G02_33055, partial [Actinosynnema sp. NPDC023658]|uniref:hypothetical protein n=1 Tax=Actinosynnema sp. NPDC023658 TaxID=3155465 RepID=UPI0033EA2900
MLRGLRGLLAALLVTTALAWPGAGSAAAAPWTLTTAQRQAYLQYYAPLIFKRGDENNSQEGTDWLSNYDFDRDGNFADNRTNWRNVNQYVAGAYSGWRIRPTLYTALIEYTENGAKNIVLLYHVYNAADKDFAEIHDWERIEIVVRGVTGTPGGAGENFSHATVTHHKDHVMRRSTDSAVKFMTTATGKHLLVWQADGSNFDGPTIATHGHELRFATTAWSTIAASMNSTSKAEVDINNASEKNVHYVFVPEADASAVSAWRAQPITSATAYGLASRLDNGSSTSWQQVKRTTYELQDLADIVPTHWQYANWSLNWLSSKSSDVLLESPVTSEAGVAEVGTGLQRFYTASRDNGASDLTDGREGILSKGWFYGAYSGEENADDISGSDDFGGYEGLGLDSYGRSRGAASGDYASHNAYWRQHDFFVHTGVVDTSDHREAGTWLSALKRTSMNFTTSSEMYFRSSSGFWNTLV